MPTTIHLPKSVLEAVDKKAAEQGISRSRYITKILVTYAGVLVETPPRTFGYSQAFMPMRQEEARAKIDEWFAT